MVIIILLIIIICLHFLSKNIDNFSNYNITKLEPPESDFNIYGGDMNILTNKNNINANKLCINGECINFLDDRNKTLPRPPGEDGVCTDNDCYECTCEHGDAAVETCNKLKSDPDREQCINCDPRYGLVNGKCVECTGDKYNDEITVNGCKSCNDLKCITTNSPNGSPYLKRINCGGSTKGTCQRKQCICGKNGIAAASCTSETVNTCIYCNKGYKLSAPSGSTGASCVVCAANEYRTYGNNNTTNCEQCSSLTCPDVNGKSQYRQNCGGTSRGTCINCPPCQDVNGKRQYRQNCGGTSVGTCIGCPSCAPGYHPTSDSSCGCAKNICTCSGGTRAEGEGCPTHNTEKCTGCDGNHYQDGNKCTKCKSSDCGSGQYRTGWTCSGGASCKAKTVCPSGYRSQGSATTDAVCKTWGPAGPWRTFYYRNGHSKHGDYKYAWIDSRSRNGNLYSYAVWDNQVVYYKNHGYYNLQQTGSSPWMPWGNGKLRRFGGEAHEYGLHPCPPSGRGCVHPGTGCTDCDTKGDDFNCEAHGRKWSGSNYNAFYTAGNPTVGGNGVCDSGGGDKWSQNTTFFRKIAYQDRNWE